MRHGMRMQHRPCSIGSSRDRCRDPTEYMILTTDRIEPTNCEARVAARVGPPCCTALHRARDPLDATDSRVVVDGRARAALLVLRAPALGGVHTAAGIRSSATRSFPTRVSDDLNAAPVEGIRGEDECWAGGATTATNAWRGSSGRACGIRWATCSGTTA